MFLMIINVSAGNWFSKLFKVISIYFSPLLLIALLWPPVIKYLFRSMVSIKMSDFSKNFFHQFSIVTDFYPTIFIIGTLLTLGLVLLYVLSKLVYFFKEKKTGMKVQKKENRIPVLFFLMMMFLVVIFLINFNSIGLFSLNSVSKPHEIFLKSIVYSNLYLAPFGWVVLLFLFAFALIRQNSGLKMVKNSNNTSPFIRKFFLFYLLLLILLTCIFTTIVYVFRTNTAFFPRYVLFLMPPFMIMFSATTEQAVLLLDFIKQRITHQPLKRFYLRNVLIISVFFAGIFVGPGAYKALSRSNGLSWRENALQIVNIVESNPAQKYLIVEAVTQNFPTMDYYLKKFSKSVRVGYLLELSANDSLKKNKDYLPELLQDKKKIVSDFDFMIVVFNHSSKNKYTQTLKRITDEFDIRLNYLNEKQKGFIIYDLHPAIKAVEFDPTDKILITK